VYPDPKKAVMSLALPRLAVFDLAGTTMLDDGSVARIFMEVLLSGGLSVTAEDVARVRGASKREAFRRLTDDPERAERLFRRFMADIQRHDAGQPPREVPGASATFAWLRERGVKVALNTGFERATVETLVSALGWADGVFDAVVSGDDVEAGRPSPAMIQEAMRRLRIADAATVMAVGDTVLDLQAGTAAGAGWVVGVTSGAHDRARLSAFPHTCLLASIADLPEMLQAVSV
jgi:phosphonatase-like hydrolase